MCGVDFDKQFDGEYTGKGISLGAGEDAQVRVECERLVRGVRAECFVRVTSQSSFLGLQLVYLAGPLLCP